MDIRERLRLDMERLWEDRVFGLWLIFSFLLGSVACLLFIPTPGVAAAVMGLAAAVMSARTKADGKEKAAWMFVLFSLLVVEVIAIRTDRREQAEQQFRFNREEAQRFAGIGEGIKASIDQSDQHFSATMADMHVLIDSSNEISRKSREAVYQLTGGDSLSFVTIAADGSGFVIVPEGDYPLYDLGVDMIGYDDKLEKHLSHFEMSPHVERPWFRAELDQFTRLDYSILFTARNGGWVETLQLRKVNGKWTTAVKVEQPVLMAHNRIRPNQPVRNKVRYMWVSPTYPEINGKVEWCEFFTSVPRHEPNPCIPNSQKK